MYTLYKVTPAGKQLISQHVSLEQAHDSLIMLLQATPSSYIKYRDKYHVDVKKIGYTEGYHLEGGEIQAPVGYSI